MADEPVYTKPTSQLWAEEQQKNGNASNKVLSTFGDAGEVPKPVDEYVGVDPMYQNAANDTEKPFRAEAGVERDLEEQVFGDKYVVSDSDDEDEPVKAEDKKETTSSSAPKSGVKAPDNK